MKDLLDALVDLHETVPRKKEDDFGPTEFKLRVRPMLEQYEHELRAAGTMDKTTFIGAFSWLFYTVAPNTTQLVHPINGRRIAFRCCVIEQNHRRVMFLGPATGTPPRTAEEAAEVLWDFFQGVSVPESWR